MSLSKRPLTRRRVLVGGALVAAGASATAVWRPILAQEATPAGSPEGAGGMPPLPPGAEVVAEGLWNPGNLAVGDDGTLYIAETGVFGGTEGPTQATPNPEGTPIAAAPPLVPPQISKVAPDGTQSVVTKEAGGVGIAVANGMIYVSEGGGSVGSGFKPLPEENTVREVNIETGEVRLLANLGEYEVEHNPDGTDVNPNLYGLAVAADGTLYVADAGGNTIYHVDPAAATFSLFVVVPNLTDLTGATPTAEEQAQQPGPRQPVPTSVVIDAGGNINVVLLSESWNGPSVLAFTPDGSYTEGVSNLSMIVNAALGPDGLMYVSQLTADFTSNPPAPGNVLRINADGSVEPVVQGLMLPHGIAFDGDGNLYVATNSIISGPDQALGQVLRFKGIAPASA